MQAEDWSIPPLPRVGVLVYDVAIIEIDSLILHLGATWKHSLKSQPETTRHAA
jgi:hypothetical protein